MAVCEFYGREAVAHGWSPGSIGSLHITDQWRKRYSNRALATLLIFTSRPFEPASGPRTY